MFAIDFTIGSDESDREMETIRKVDEITLPVSVCVRVQALAWRILKLNFLGYGITQNIL